jgi:hypothetical protein
MFVYPGCGGGRTWLLKTKAFPYECAACGRQTSVTAGTIMHASKRPLTIWFWAAFLMATHSNGISALQLENQLGFGACRTARMLCVKQRRAAAGQLCRVFDFHQYVALMRSSTDWPTGCSGGNAPGQGWGDSPTYGATPTA